MRLGVLLELLGTNSLPAQLDNLCNHFFLGLLLAKIRENHRTDTFHQRELINKREQMQ